MHPIPVHSLFHHSVSLTLLPCIDRHFVSSQADTPYAIIVDGTGKVTEQRLGNQAAGTTLPPSVTVVSSSVDSNKIRTVTLTRPLVGQTPNHYTFDANANAINVLAAQGTTSTLSYHGPTRGSGVLTLAKPGEALCINRDPTTNAGTIAGG